MWIRQKSKEKITLFANVLVDRNKARAKQNNKIAIYLIGPFYAAPNGANFP